MATCAMSNYWLPSREHYNTREPDVILRTSRRWNKQSALIMIRKKWYYMYTTHDHSICNGPLRQQAQRHKLFTCA